MSEDFPTGEQPIKPEDQLGEAALEHVSEPTPIEITDNPVESAVETTADDAHESEDRRWDKQKAETLAEVLQQGGTPKDTLEHLGEIHQKIEAAKKGELDPESLRSGETPEAFVERLENVREAVSEKMTEKADHTLSPYEELYNLNPERFANMPTSEFMGVAGRYISTEGTIHGLEDCLGNGVQNPSYYGRVALESWRNSFNEAIATEDIQFIVGELDGSLDRNRNEASMIGHMFDRYDLTADEAKSLGFRPLAYHGSEIVPSIKNKSIEEAIEAAGVWNLVRLNVLKEFSETTENAIDKTPRQIAEARIALIDKYAGFFQKRLDAAKQEQQELLSQYRPDSTHEQ